MAYLLYVRSQLAIEVPMMVLQLLLNSERTWQSSLSPYRLYIFILSNLGGGKDAF